MVSFLKISSTLIWCFCLTYFWTHGGRVRKGREDRKGFYKIGFVLPSACPDVFLELIIIFCLNFLLEIHSKCSKFWKPYEVVRSRVGLFEKKTKSGENWPKAGLLNLLKNLIVHFFWIWSMIKVYIICYIPAQIPHLGKIWSLIYGPKCCWPITLQDFKINCISKTKSWKLKVDWKILRWT